jgi:crotonobetainyl-CoA:carnitine CoA-transferase CaiB-like acyl-CoA transferase
MFPCADGYVVIVSRSREDWLAIIAAMGSPEWARRPGWEDPLSVAEHHADEADELLEAWLGGLSCADAVALGRRHGFAIARMLDPLEAIATEQMRARRFTQAPGAHVADDIPRLDAPMLPTIVARGEDAADPAGTDARLAGAPAGARGAASRPGGASVPLAELLRGVRVLDLSWVWSGPATTMMLAALGADVVKVESSRRPDGSRLRGRPNTAAGVPVDGPILEVTPYFHQVNAGKRSVELDLHSPDGREAIRALANRSDVLVENMRPGVLARHGLGYASLSETNPGLVMLSMSLAGQHGPLAGAKGYASIMSAMSGLESLVGYSPDDVTGMLTVAVGDPNAATYGVLSVLAALRERERTGYGTLLDLSQIEAAVCGLLGTLSAFADDREAAWGYGNWHAQHAPYGTFPSSDGGWVALAVRDDEEWHGVVDALGDPRLRDARLRLAAARRRERVALNELIAGATSRIERSGLVRRLLLAGVLAVPVLALGERDEDTGFAAPARHAMPMAHPYAPGERLVTPPWDVDGERPQFSMRAPLLGEHTEAVLAGLSTGPRR